MKSVQSSDQNGYYEVNGDFLLGKGSFGSVYQAFHIDKHGNKTEIAAKTIDHFRMQDKIMQKNLKNEITILKDKHIKSPNIVEIYDVICTKTNIYIFLELCQTDLRTYLQQRGRLSQKEALIFFKQICDGFKVLRQKEIVHRDIKPENILINMQGDIKIADFGLSRIIEENDPNQEYTSGVGTPKYKSPEMINNEIQYGSKIDIWSLGITFYELIYGYTPWNGNDIKELYDNVLQHQLQFNPQIPCSPQIQQLISRMLDKNAETRIDWNEIFTNAVYLEETEQFLQQQMEEMKQMNIQNSYIQSQQLSNFYTEKTKLVSMHNKSQMLSSFNGTESNQAVNQQQEQQNIQQQQQNNINMQQQQQQIYSQDMEIIKCIYQIDKYFQSIRMTSMYLNSLANSIFMYKNTLTMELGIKEQIIIKVMFVLLKKFFIQQKQLVDTLIGRNPSPPKFDPSMMQYYLMSKNYQDTIQLIELDVRQVQPFFFNFLEQIGKINFQDPEFQSILNNQFDAQFNQQFPQIFEIVCSQFVQECRNTLFNSQLQNKIDLFKLMLNTLICRKSELIFDFNENKEFDFFKFDEQFQNMNEQQYYEEIQKYL